MLALILGVLDLIFRGPEFFFLNLIISRSLIYERHTDCRKKNPTSECNRNEFFSDE